MYTSYVNLVDILNLFGDFQGKIFYYNMLDCHIAL